MRRIGPSTLLTTFLVSAGGCNEAVHTLGVLPVDTSHGAPCPDGSTPALGGACAGGEAPADASVTGGAGGASPVDGGQSGEAGRGTGGRASGGQGGSAGTASCTPKRALATRRGLNLLLLVDDSPSVVLQPVWTSLTAAISAFALDAANTGLGLGIEYYGTSCTAKDYANPVVPIADLPDNAAKINASFPLPLGGKAIVPAMAGAAMYVRDVIAADQGRDAALVLVTDGILDPICGATAATAESQAALALASAPSVTTYVVALGAGPTLIDPADIVDLAPLDAIAKAGGSTKAERVEVNASSNAELTTALDSVAARAAPCAFRIPSGLVASRVSFEWQPAAGKPAAPWPRVGSASACGSRAGVYPSATVGYLTLCPASCTALRASPSGTAAAVEACAAPP